MLLNWWYRIGSNVWVWYLTQGHIDCRHQPPTFWSLVHHFPMSALPKPHDGQHINPMSAKVIKWSAMSTFKSFPMQSAEYSMNKFMERCKAVGIERMIDLANSDMTQIVQICAAFSNHPGVSGGGSYSLSFSIFRLSCRTIHAYIHLSVHPVILTLHVKIIFQEHHDRNSSQLAQTLLRLKNELFRFW